MTKESSPEVNAEAPEAPVLTAVEAVLRRTDLYPVEEKRSQAAPIKRASAVQAETDRKANLYAKRATDRKVTEAPPAGAPFPGENVVGPDRSHLGANQVSQEMLVEMLNDLAGEMTETVELLRDEKKLDGQRVEELTELRQRAAGLQSELSQVTAALEELESKGTVAEEAFDRTKQHETDLQILGNAVHTFIADHYANLEAEGATFRELPQQIKDTILWKIGKQGAGIGFSAITQGRFARLHRFSSPAPDQVDISLDRCSEVAEKLDLLVQKFSTE